MKKNWQAVITIAALNIVLGGMSATLAQQVPIAGGYAETSNTDAKIVRAATFATSAAGRKQRARISLISIERAEVQVVAGLNYRLRLKVKTNGKAQDVTAVVYQNLKQRYSLTSWEPDARHAGRGSVARSASTIEQLVAALAEAYTAKTLGSLDAERPIFGSVRISIEHSLAGDGDKDAFETKTFKSLAQAEQWLKSREREDGTPLRNTRPLLQCGKGLCTYNFDGGILHNQLYLRQISYGLRRGRPYIKTIYLLDGD